MKNDTIIVIENDKKDYDLVKKTLGTRYNVYPESFRMMANIISRMLNADDKDGGSEALFSVLRDNYTETKAILFDLYLSNDDDYPSTSYIQDIRQYNNSDNQILNEFCKSVPIIAYTHSCDKADEIDAMQYGATYFLKKPLNEFNKGHRKLLESIITTCIVAQNKSISVPERIRKNFFKFKMEHVDKTTAFIMVAFKHIRIAERIKQILKDQLQIEAYIANAPAGKYDHDLLMNLETFMYGCDFGIGIYTDESVPVYDDSTSENAPIINPNLSFEVGYMMALKKNVFIICALKEGQRMPADIIGLIHIKYDQNIDISIKTALKNRGIITENEISQKKGDII